MSQLKKILMVDDDADLREALADQLLLTEEFDVFEAGNGADGLAKSKEQHYDLVILDVGLPDMDGRELCRLMRKQVSADAYTRFLALESQYPVNGYEDMRPYFVADALHGNAVRANGLTNDPDVVNRIQRLVRRNRQIKETTIQMGPEFLDFEFLKSSGERYLSSMSGSNELECFEITLQSLETDLNGMRARANAWALGYVDDIRYYEDYPDQYGTCLQVFTSMGDLQLQIRKANEEWLAAAEKALANNTTTFALLTMNQLIKPEGLLEQLRARGYVINEP